jgi:hypothetical protein
MVRGVIASEFDPYDNFVSMHSDRATRFLNEFRDLRDLRQRVDVESTRPTAETIEPVESTAGEGDGEQPGAVH